MRTPEETIKKEIKLQKGERIVIILTVLLFLICLVFHEWLGALGFLISLTGRVRLYNLQQACDDYGLG